MAKKVIVLGHVISKNEVEVDKAKDDFIVNLPASVCLKDVRSSLGYIDFYHHLIKDFRPITKPLINILAKNVLFHFSKEFHEAFSKLMEALTSTPILNPPIWVEPF